MVRGIGDYNIRETRFSIDLGFKIIVDRDPQKGIDLLPICKFLSPLIITILNNCFSNYFDVSIVKLSFDNFHPFHLSNNYDFLTIKMARYKI